MPDRNPPGGPGDPNHMLDRLEGELQDIEVREIVKGMTSEELDQKGFTGDKPVAVERVLHRMVSDKEKLAFEPGMEFQRLTSSAQFEHLKLAPFSGMVDAVKGTLVASRPVGTLPAFGAGFNIRMETTDTEEKYYAETNGKLLIIKDKLYLLPSDADAEITVKVSNDKSKALLTCAPAKGGGKPLTIAGVSAEIKQVGVVAGILHDVVAKTVAEANKNKTARTDVLIAQGQAAVHGTKGSVHYKFDMEAPEPEFQILSDGRVDYRTNANILVARKGDMLAIIELPGKGVPGFTVRGDVLPARTGEPVRLTAGKNIRVANEGREFYAETEGQIVLNGNHLEVLEMFVVNSDIDFASGNVQFNGNVLINGDVKDGFEVKATGDIIILKNVEAARVEAGRDVRIKGGILSRGKGLVSAGRHIIVDYVQNARLEAQGDIRIGNFTVNSYLCTTRRLIMQTKRGTILGGEVYARQGVDVKVIGSENGIKTLVEVGTDFLVRKKMVELEEAVKFCVTNIEKIESVLRPVLELLKSNPSAFASRKEIVRKTLAKKCELESQTKGMKSRIQDLQEKLTDEEESLIKVSIGCHADVQLRIREQQLTVHKLFERISFFEDREGQTIGMTVYNPA